MISREEMRESVLSMNEFLKACGYYIERFDSANFSRARCKEQIERKMREYIRGKERQR